MIKFFLVLSILFALTANAKTIKIVEIDSGYSAENVPNLKICPKGLIDLTGKGMTDHIGHSSNILGIISESLKDIDYCVYVIKIYDTDSEIPFIVHLFAYSLIYNMDNVDIVNYSSVGYVHELVEDILIKGLLARNIIFNVAAGNEGYDLDKNCNAWPACIDGVTSVGNLKRNGSRSKTSNYGNIVKSWRVGTDICSGGYCMSGTSMSTAVETAIKAKQLSLKVTK